MIRLAFLFILTLSSCCPLTGNAAAWSFATKRPEDAALVGNYKADWILRASNDTWKRGHVDLRSDGTATVTEFPVISSDYGFDAVPKEPVVFSGEGRWKVGEEKVGEQSFFNVIITVEGTPYTLTVWHNTPPHELWIQVGDEDAGEGVLFRRVSR
ncbi:MAG TPA: hypothetical protein VHN77_14410 [Phycisphaerales bacterium]|nr:hypothetical protein [Phycisphaerales bacterium]